MISKLGKAGESVLAWLSVAVIMIGCIIFFLNLASNAETAVVAITEVQEQVFDSKKVGTLANEVMKAKNERMELKSDIRNLVTQSKNINDNIDRLVNSMDKTNDKFDRLIESQMTK